MKISKSRIKQLIREVLLKEDTFDSKESGTSSKRNPFSGKDLELTGVAGKLAKKASKQNTSTDSLSSSEPKKDKVEKPSNKNISKPKSKAAATSKEKDNYIRGGESEQTKTIEWGKNQLLKTAEYFNDVIFPWAEDEDDKSDIIVDKNYATKIRKEPMASDSVGWNYTGGFLKGDRLEKSTMKVHSKQGTVSINRPYNVMIRSAANLGATLPLESISYEDEIEHRAKLYSNRK